MPTVTIALVGDPTQPQLGVQGAGFENFDLPYDNLPKTELAVDADEALSSILQRAARRFEVATPTDDPFTPSWVAFYRPQDDQAYSGHHDTTVTLVDDAGRAVWNVYFMEPTVTFSALVDSHRAGAFADDPYRPYLILEPGYGNGIAPSWAEILYAWFVLRGVLGSLADAHGAAAAMSAVARRAGRLFDRLRKAPEVVEEHSKAWEKRGGFPYTVGQFLDRQPWNADVLASLLGCTEEETVTLLRGRGFALDDASGLWYPAGDDDGRILRRVVDRIYSLEWWEETLEGRQRFEAELREKIIEELDDDK